VKKKLAKKIQKKRKEKSCEFTLKKKKTPAFSQIKPQEL
jgi:hypothetical protein